MVICYSILSSTYQQGGVPQMADSWIFWQSHCVSVYMMDVESVETINRQTQNNLTCIAKCNEQSKCLIHQFEIVCRKQFDARCRVKVLALRYRGGVNI